jgi:two-component system sensor histidine kinase MprB
VASAVAVALAVAFGSLAAYLAVQARLRADVDASLRAQVARTVPQDGGGFGPPQREFGRPPRNDEPTVYVQYVAADGTRTHPGQGGIELDPDARAQEVAAGGGGAYFSDEEVSGSHLRVLTAPLGGGTAIQVARPLGEVDSLLDRLRTALLAVSGAGVAMGALLGWVISGRALRPVTRFTERTVAIAGAGDPRRRLDGEGDDELGRLAGSFNTTLDALQRSVESQRQLVADASHELRTPLASLRTNVEVLQRGDALSDADRADLLSDLVTQTDELTSLVADVVDIARRGEPADDPQEVRLDHLVAAGLDRARRLAPRVELTQRLEPWVVSGSPERLTRLVANLVDNAVKWSPPGAGVEVALEAGELSVRDHGPGIAPADLPLVFDRFYRSPAARSLPGSGLGLAIVRQVAEAHGAVATAENAEGGGARLRVVFPGGPLAPPHPPSDDRDGDGEPEGDGRDHDVHNDEGRAAVLAGDVHQARDPDEGGPGGGRDQQPAEDVAPISRRATR